MAKTKTSKILVQGSEITLLSSQEADYFSLTDIARKFDERTDLVLQTWMRNMGTIEYLGLWEELHNAGFNPYGFAGIKEKTGSNSFYVSISHWISATNAIGIQSKPGRYGGTFAHKDIALQFCYWLSPTFQLYLIKEFQRLQALEAEQNQQALDWNLNRAITRLNYRFHTDAIEARLIPMRLARSQAAGFIYASEADLLNIALFGMTAKEWQLQNSLLKGNLRDHATTEQLLVLSNLENLNAHLIKEGLAQDERLQKLNEVAVYQMQVLTNSTLADRIKQLPDAGENA